MRVADAHTAVTRVTDGMVKILNPKKPTVDIITAADVVNATRGVRVTGGPIVAPATIDPQVAALEKYLVLADKGITILSQIQGLMGKYRDIVGSNAPTAPPPAHREPYQEDVSDLPPRHPNPSIDGVAEPAEPVEPMEVIPMPQTSIKSVGAAQISQVLAMILSQQPELTVEQLKQLIDNNPDMIDHLLHVYMTGEADP